MAEEKPLSHRRRFGDGEKEMRCPQCGRESPEDVRFCSVCGAPLGGTHAFDQPASLPAQKQEKDNTLLIVVVVMVVAVAFVGVFALMWLG